MKKIISLLLSVFTVCTLTAQGIEEMPVIEVGEYMTTHVLFMTDLTYVDVSIPDCILARIVDASKNMLAMKARKPFDFVTTISALEANGTMHTFKVSYAQSPGKLLVDTRNLQDPRGSGQVNTQTRPQTQDSVKTNIQKTQNLASVNVTSEAASNFSRIDAPTLEEVVRNPKQFYHLGDKNSGMEAYCTNIYVYSDLTYLVLNVKNNTDIGFEAGDAQFTIENKSAKAKTLATDKPVWMKSSYGTLSCAPHSETRVGYTIPKLTLMKGQCLKIYIYEKSGVRNLTLTLTEKDINYAASPKVIKSTNSIENEK